MMVIGRGNRQRKKIYLSKAAWLVIGLVLAGALLLAMSLEANRQERVRLAAFHSDIADQARIYETVIGSKLQDYDDTLLALRDFYLHDPKNLAEHVRLLRGGHLADPEILVVYADRHGYLEYTDTPGAKLGMNLGDRPWFRFFADGGGDRLYVDEPTFGRVTKRYTLPLSRSIYDKNGNFHGVIALSVKQQSLIDFGSRLQLAGDNVLTIVNKGGALVSRSRDLDKMHGTAIPAPLLALMLTKPEGVLTDPAATGGAGQVVAFRHFLDEKIPLIIAVEGSSKEVLRQTALQRRVLLVSAGLTSLVVMALIGVFLKGRETSLQLIDTLRRSKEQEYETLTGTILDGFFVGDLSGRILDTNDTLCRMLDYSQEEIMSLSLGDLEPVDSSEQVADRIRQAMAEGSTRFQSRLRSREDRLIDVEISAQFIEGPEGLFFVFVHDITDTKQAEEQRRSHLTFLQNLAKVDRAMKLETDPEQMLWKVVQTVFAIFDCDRAWLLYPCNPDSPTFRVPVEVTRPEYPGAKVLNVDVPLSDAEAKNLREALAAEGPVVYVEGTDRPVVTAKMFGVRSQMFVAVFPRMGEPWAFGMHQCSCPRVWSEEEKSLFNEIGRRLADGLSSVLSLRELQENEQRFRATFEQAAVGIAHVAVDGLWLRVNQKLCDIVGYSREELLQKTFQDITHPDDLESDMANVRRILAGEINTYSMEKRYVRKDGSIVWIYLTVSVVRRTTGDLPEYFISVIEDITERKRAEEENARLETQLQQAQKMEAIGQLAGGVAHDFNNMLGVILGHAELAMAAVDGDQPIQGDLEQIYAAAQRSSDITRQLLAFARRQAIVPKVIDLNEVVQAILKMLRRLLGEDIELTWKPGSGLWSIKMDPAQIDQLLANLCVNARGAIAGVGMITVETANCTFDEEYCAVHAGFLPGEYIRLTVSDNGCGMTREVMPHIFEPFFTTKEVGKGTGLGLATVYGAVKQNNGFINVYSEPGEGTIFRIYLPRYRGDMGIFAPKEAGEATLGGKETILLVEDEPTILVMTTTMLQRLGYTVLAAASPREALSLVEEHPGVIDLLVTDVIMPDMNGRDLAEMLVAAKPGLKCLFMSGYTADIIAIQGVLDEKVSFIQKPFSKTELAGKVRQVLDSGKIKD